MKAQTYHAVSDAYGIHIPRIFCEKYKNCIAYDGDKLKEEMQEAINTCLHEEDCDDAWDYIIENAVIVLGNLPTDDDPEIRMERYRIHQDGDVWLIPCQKEVKWVPDEDCEISDYDLHKNYDSMLDDVYPDCKVASYTYSTSTTLKGVDPIAYRCGFSDWLDSELDDKELVEIDGKYYRVSAKEPEDYTDYWFEQDEHEGHYEWIELQQP